MIICVEYSTIRVAKCSVLNEKSILPKIAYKFNANQNHNRLSCRSRHANSKIHTVMKGIQNSKIIPEREQDYNFEVVLVL